LYALIIAMYEVMMTYRIYNVVVDRCVPVESSSVTVEVNASEEAHQLLATGYISVR
jgi:hypothetical protein